MMQFVIDGQRLELPAGFDLQFTKKNSLFAFDALTCDRSTSFSIPATPTNDRILGLAKLPAAYGAGMRKKFAAQLQGSAVAENGYLYVTAYSGGAYQCVFVFGDLLGVKDFDNAKFGSLILPNDKVTGSVVNADTTPSPLAAYVKYHNNLDAEEFYALRPSVDVGKLLAQINAQGLLNIDGLENVVLRLIRNSEFLYKYDRVLEYLKNENPTQGDMGLSTAGDIITTGTITTISDGVYREETASFALSPNTKTRITFPADTPADLCLVYPIYESGTGMQYTHIGFLGSRRFERPTTQGGDVVYSGEPLAGQTVEINLPNPEFMLMTGAGLEYNAQAQNIDFAEFDFTLQPDYNIAVRVSADALYLGSGGQLPAVASLMDLSLGDLLKMYAARTGKLIGATRDTIKFIDAFDLQFIEPIAIEQKQVTRKFSDFAQQNFVQFSESENVLPEERLQAEYDIDNENIEAKKDILTLAATEGGKYNENDLLLVRGVTQEGYQYNTPNDVLAEAAGDAYLSRTSLVKSDIMQSVCDLSTSIELTAKMPLFEFVRLDSEKGIYYAGTPYVWTEAQWSKDVATLKLSKTIAPEATPIIEYFTYLDLATIETSEMIYNLPTLMNVQTNEIYTKIKTKNTQCLAPVVLFSNDNTLQYTFGYRREASIAYYTQYATRGGAQYQNIEARTNFDNSIVETISTHPTISQNNTTIKKEGSTVSTRVVSNTNNIPLFDIKNVSIRRRDAYFSQLKIGTLYDFRPCTRNGRVGIMEINSNTFIYTGGSVSN